MTGDNDEITALDPETVSPGDVDTEGLRAALEREDNLVRTHAARLVSAVAERDLDSVEPLVPTLVGALDDDRIVVLRESLVVLAAIAEDSPEAVREAIPSLCSLLEHETPLIPALASEVVRVLAVERAEWFVPHVGELVTAMETEPTDPTAGGADAFSNDAEPRAHVTDVYREELRRQITARTVVANVVYEVATIDPESVRPHASRFVALIEAGSGAVLSASVCAVNMISEANPEAVENAVEPLCDRLSVPDRAVQVHAVSALGNVGDPTAVEPLREFADGDAPLDDEIRSLARTTADGTADDSRTA
ncbi:HEAT repeat domain-containing protein [Haladaptatus sp. T7]|uniref:HEAT repeat domain-containing protein n=1 Tax=Haladaptatus sp. T7 TaxID=2029368 RepID=UPI0021A25290|nr:HEAT repeat domain-containing protein [Haladaptatus sp. T7]GKZ14480.1 hypothetical protein HAL_23610 [Haladaptatus sp. T7]